MTVPPHPGRPGRAALAARLTGLRVAAGLSGNALAKKMGVLQSRVWKIENGQLLPNEDDIAAWAAAAGAGEETGALAQMLADARSEQKFGAVYRRKGGAVAYQDRLRGIEEQATRIGEFEVGVIPGLLQTADYAREVLALPGGLRAWGLDGAEVEAMIDMRLRRQEVLTARGKQVQMVVSEAALRMLVAEPGTVAGQLDKLLAVMRLPAVELGVIGLGSRLPAYPLGGFRVYDSDLVVAETLAGERYFTADQDPDEVAAFGEAFAALRAAAVYGADAERLIEAAAAALRA